MTTFRAAILLLLGALCFSTTGMFQSIAPEDASPWIVGEEIGRAWNCKR